MRIILTQPDSKAHTITPLLGLGYLAAAVRQQGHDVTIVDLAKKRMKAKKGVRELVALEPDLIGVSILSTAYLQARELINEIRQALPDVRIVVGGPHVTALPEDSLSDLGVDIVVLGEAELVFPALVDRMSAGKVLDDRLPSLCMKKGETTICSEQAGFLQELDLLPFPAWDLMDPRTYPDLPHQLLHRKLLITRN